MSNIIPARIQNRRGKRQNLPQPLLPGELGFCVDTNELFIGSDPTDPSSITYPVITVYDAYVGGDISGLDPNDAQFSDMVYTAVANKIIDEYVVQVDLSNPADVANYDHILNLADVTGVTTEPVKVVNHILDSNDNVIHTRIYIARDTPLMTTEVDFGGVLSHVGNNVPFRGTKADFTGILVSGNEYNVYDSHAIAKLINYVFDYSGDFITAIGHGTGLVTVGQNIQVYTDSTKAPSERQLTAQFELIDSPDRASGLWYSLYEDDAYIIHYSIKSANYVRSGKLTVTFLNYDAMLSDDYQEMINAPLSTPPDINFWATTVGDVSDEVVEIRYNGLGLEPDTILSAHTLRWKSF